MPDPWQSYAAVNDDLRQTYERVFYGRQLTGNAMQADVAGMAEQPATSPGAAATAPEASAGTVQACDLYGPDLSHEERMSGATAYAHAANAPGIRREIEESGPDGRPYQSADAPDLVARGADSRAALYGPQMGDQGAGAKPPATSADLYGPDAGKAAETGSVWGPTQGSTSTPAASGNDLTPG